MRSEAIQRLPRNVVQSPLPNRRRVLPQNESRSEHRDEILRQIVDEHPSEGQQQQRSQPPLEDRRAQFRLRIALHTVPSRLVPIKSLTR